MNKPIYPEVEFVITSESWDDVFLDEDGEEIVFEEPRYIPPKIHWRTNHGKQQYGGWVNLDLQIVINDSQIDIVNIHKGNIMRELKHRIGF